MEEKHGFFDYAIELVTDLNKKIDSIEDRYLQEKDHNPNQALNYRSDIMILQDMRDLAISTIADPEKSDDDRYAIISETLATYSGHIHDGGLKDKLAKLSKDASERKKDTRNLEDRV